MFQGNHQRIGLFHLGKPEANEIRVALFKLQCGFGENIKFFVGARHSLAQLISRSLDLYCVLLNRKQIRYYAN